MEAVAKSNKFRIFLFVLIFLAQILIFRVQFFADHSINLPFGWTATANTAYVVCDGSNISNLENKGFPFKEWKSHASQDACYGTENSIAPLLNFAFYGLIAVLIAFNSNEVFKGEGRE